MTDVTQANGYHNVFDEFLNMTNHWLVKLRMLQLDEFHIWLLNSLLKIYYYNCVFWIG